VVNNDATTQARELARSQISGPAVGLLVTGIVGGFFALITMVGTGVGSLFELGSRWLEDLPEWYEEMFQGAFAFGGALVELLVAAFIIYAALKMKDLQQWGLAVAASILAMLPCVSPCCIIGLPIGIWCLVVLMRPGVKDAFL
jgi:hypothetical protein